MQTFPGCSKFSRTEFCLLSNDTRSAQSQRAKQPRYNIVYSFDIFLSCHFFQFWTSFYEQAAQVRIPTSDDLSSLHETSPGVAMEESHASSRPEDLSVASGFNADTFNPNRTPSESSFVPAQAAVSSTPAATAARTRVANDTSFTPLPPGTDPSWGMSLESPLVRLDRELREFGRADPQPASTSASIDIFSEADLTVGNVTTVVVDETVHAPTPAPAPAPSDTREIRPTVQTHVVPPLSFRRNPATPARNPYISAHTDPRHWSGIVDLRSPQPPGPSFSAAVAEKEDDPTLPVGMSPPVMVPFATLPSLGRSPAKTAAENIRRALVRDALRADGGDSNVSGSGSGSLVPTPPSLARYTRGTSASLEPDLELESMMRHVLDPSQPHWWQSSAASSTSISDKSRSTPSYYTTPAPSTHAYAHEAVPAPSETPPSSSVGLPLVGGDADTTIDATPESEDSTSTFSSSGEDSVHNTAHPSAAFLLASRQRGLHDYDDDDELDQDDGFDDSLDADADIAPVHPFARARASAHGEYEDDSFDSLDGEEDEGGDMPEETVFGLRPAERNEAARLQPRLRMYGEDLLQDTMDIGTRLARAGRIEESPTPWGSGGGGGGNGGGGGRAV
jgi:DASH complex subunit ASK1